MNWESFYLICFFVGFLLSLVSFLAQATHFHLPGTTHGVGAGHIGHSHIGHGHVGHAHAGNASSPVLSKFNFGTITAFLAWFGGTGYLLQRHANLWTVAALALSTVSGLIGAAIVFWVLAKLMAHDRTLDPADYDLVGVLGHVSSGLRAGGIGEMVFSQEGVRRAVPIRSEDGASISKGVEVVITKYERGVGYVRRWDEMTGMATDEESRAAGM